MDAIGRILLDESDEAERLHRVFGRTPAERVVNEHDRNGLKHNSENPKIKPGRYKITLKDEFGYEKKATVYVEKFLFDIVRSYKVWKGNTYIAFEENSLLNAMKK